jgi:hypothetical protein
MSLQNDINLLLTCSPSVPCPREEACFRVAKYLRDHLHSESPAPYTADEIPDDGVITRYAPHWESYHSFVLCRDE